VVDDVVVGDIVQEETALPAQEIPVNSARCATLVAPLLVAIMGKQGVGVMQVGDHDEPMGDGKPGNAVVFDDFGGTPLVARPDDTIDHGSNASIGHENKIALAFSEEHRVRVEMIGPNGIVLLAGDIENYSSKLSNYAAQERKWLSLTKISRESKELLAYQHVQCV
jgi:hypothetical protein